MFHKEGSKIIFITLLLVVGVIFATDFITLVWLKVVLDLAMHQAVFAAAGCRG